MPRRLMIIPDSPNEILEKRGVKRRPNKSKTNFIGKNAKTSFFDTMQKHLVNPALSIELGSLYTSAVYEKTVGSKQRTYEFVYSFGDYSQAVSQDASLVTQLDTLFGSSPLSDVGDLNETQIATALGPSRSLPNKVNIVDKKQALVRAQNNVIVVLDEDSEGITGVGVDNTSVEPFV